MNTTKRIVLLISLPAILSACQGGGADPQFGSGGIPSYPAPGGDLPIYDQQPSLGDTAPRSSFETPEYAFSRFLGRINAAARYAQGATGKGILVGVIDAGVDMTIPEMEGAVIDALSYDYASDTATSVAHGNHGTWMAGAIGARRDGTGMHGVAPEVSIASYSAIADDIGHWNSSDAVADSYNRLTQAGGFGMNGSYSIGINDVTLTTANASRSQMNGVYGNAINSMRHASSQGVLSVFSTGNHGGSDTSILAALPSLFPELEDTWLAVTALNDADQLADFATACGDAAQWCVAAPGTGIVSPNAGGGYSAVNGTSPAAAIGMGSLALLKSNFPELSGREVRQILLDTARDIGAPGTDAVFGNGAIDLENAVAPQGTILVQGSSVLDEQTWAANDSYVSGVGAVAASLSQTLSAATVGVTDHYGRGYAMNVPVTVSDRSEDPVMGFKAQGLSSGTFQNGFDRISSGEKPLVYAMVDGSNSVFSASVKNDLDGGGLKLSGSFETGAGLLSVSAGEMRETDALLGTSLSGAYAGDTRTRFVELDWSTPLPRAARLDLHLGLGASELDGNGILKSKGALRSSTMGLRYSKALDSGHSFTLGVSSPLALDSGRLQMDRPTGVIAAAGGQRGTGITRETQEFEIGKAGRDLDLEFGFGGALDLLGNEGRYGIGLVADLKDPLNAYALSLNWIVNF